MEPATRKIVHVDMDAFFASVEQRDDPSLAGRPVVVGGDAARGVVAAASYEARRFGVFSAMPTARARRLCPALVVVRPRFARYKEVSAVVFGIFRTVTPLVEPLSIDEAFLDVTENAWGEPLGVEVAKRLKAAVREATGLTASAGVAPNKFLAKLASGFRKPDGLTVVAPRNLEAFLSKLPVDALWGVGPVTARRLREAGVTRLVDVREAPEETLRRAVGSFCETLRRLSFGLDDRPVVPDRASKSAGAERTFETDLTGTEALEEPLAAMSGRVAAWLGKRRLFGRTVTLKVRYADFTTVTRSLTELPAVQDEASILARARRLLARTEAASRPVRLLGVSVHGFCDGPTPPPRRPSPQLPLFDPDAPP